jgi:hypothetical protein
LLFYLLTGLLLALLLALERMLKLLMGLHIDIDLLLKLPVVHLEDLKLDMLLPMLLYMLMIINRDAGQGSATETALACTDASGR